MNVSGKEREKCPGQVREKKLFVYIYAINTLETNKMMRAEAKHKSTS